jgi:CHAT domain-containing protein
VESGATVKLATRAFSEVAANPRIPRAEAFRISMRELIANGRPFDAHPSQWAPFVVVGNGGAR